MEREEWMNGADGEPEAPGLTMAIIELSSAQWPAQRRAFAWIGMDVAPYFPRLQRYLARLSMSHGAEIDHIHVESSGLAHAIDLRFDCDRPTIH